MRLNQKFKSKCIFFFFERTEHLEAANLLNIIMVRLTFINYILEGEQWQGYKRISNSIRQKIGEILSNESCFLSFHKRYFEIFNNSRKDKLVRFYQLW